jgi:hypothetical protein
MRQVGGVRLLQLDDGNERGARAAEFRTGTGFSFLVLIDRGLDISRAEYCGRALGWQSMTGDAHPAFFEPEGLGWLRTFYGGLLVTCGLNWMGAPCRDEEAGPKRLGPRDLGLHGRISHTPAASVYADAAWEGNDYRIWIRGKMRESLVFGEDLLLTREISTRLGENCLWVRDTVENVGYERAEQMLLYHINIGFPALDSSSELIAPTLRSTPRDVEAEVGKEQYAQFQAPTAGYHEQAYFHDLAAGPDGMTATAIVNRDLGHGAYVRFSREALPYYTEWKMMGQRNYVVGMEPGNALPLGRVAERNAGRLQYLDPGPKRDFLLEIGALTTREEIDTFEREVKGWL